MKIGHQTANERVIIYGDAKTLKTRLATALPWGGMWGEKAIYIAADLNAINLRSVLTVDKEHLVPVEPRPEKGKYDPLAEAVACASRPWVTEYPGARTLIWDTITQTAFDILAHYARLGNYAKEQITFGKPGTPEHHAHPTMGDYGAAQNSVCEHVLGLIFQQPLHVIVLAHADWHEPKEGGEIVGGPATIGGAKIKTLPGRFDSVIHTEVKYKGEPGKPRVPEFMARTQKHGIWIAGVRGQRGMPDTILNPADPRDFWRAYEEAIK